MKNIWIIGAGGIAIEYAKVLIALGHEFTVIGRSEEGCKRFENETGIKPISGGLDKFLDSSPQPADYALNCVRAFELAKVNITLMKYGVGKVLTEKPGFYPNEVNLIRDALNHGQTKIFVAYNRRFYSSVLEAERIIKEDGGLTSFNFEFTEWKHVIEKTTSIPQIEKNNLLIGNSSHVIDLAFFLGGMPKDISCYHNGTVGWHTPANFSGAGITEKGALFSYQANWNAPGRWAVELLTSKHRIYLKPMEQLYLQDICSVKVYPVEIDNRLDKEYKPGFYLETKAFLENDTSRLCSINEQIEHTEYIYNKILGR